MKDGCYLQKSVNSATLLRAYYQDGYMLRYEYYYPEQRAHESKTNAHFLHADQQLLEYDHDLPYDLYTRHEEP